MLDLVDAVDKGETSVTTREVHDWQLSSKQSSREIEHQIVHIDSIVNSVAKKVVASDG